MLQITRRICSYKSGELTSGINGDSWQLRQSPGLYDVMRLPVRVSIAKQQRLGAESILRYDVSVTRHDVTVGVALRHFL